MTNINETKYGIAYRIKDDIYINNNLKKYPDLRKAIISHELKHSKGFTKKDIAIDIFNDDLEKFKKQYYAFILTHPSTWTEFLPITIKKKTIIINPIMILFWIITIAFILFVYFGIK